MNMVRSYNHALQTQTRNEHTRARAHTLDADPNFKGIENVNGTACIYISGGFAPAEFMERMNNGRRWWNCIVARNPSLCAL